MFTSTNIPGAIFSWRVENLHSHRDLLRLFTRPPVIGHLVARHLRCRHAADERDYAIEFLKRVWISVHVDDDPLPDLKVPYLRFIHIRFDP